MWNSERPQLIIVFNEHCWNIGFNVGVHIGDEFLYKLPLYSFSIQPQYVKHLIKYWDMSMINLISDDDCHSIKVHLL